MRGNFSVSAWYAVLTRLTGPAIAPLPLDLFEMPEDGPLVIVSSHVSWADHFALGMLTAVRRGQALAVLSHVRFHRHAIVRALWHRPLGSLPVGGGHTEASLATCRAILADGGTVCVYPTGRLLEPTAPGSFRRGAFELARTSDAPMLCVGLAYAPKAAFATPWAPRTPTVAFELLSRESVKTVSCAALVAHAEQRVMALELHAAAADESATRAARGRLADWAQQLDKRSDATLRMSEAYILRSRGHLARTTAAWADRTRAAA